MAEAKETEAVKVTEMPPLEVPNKDFVRYVGVCSTRLIRVDEWPTSVPSNKRPKTDVVWNKFNGWYIPKSEFSAECLQVLADDGSFVISEK